VCGDGKCEAPETSASCPEDCVLLDSQCGDGTCALDETCDSCQEDCGECWFDEEGNPNCSHLGTHGSTIPAYLVALLLFGLLAVRTRCYCRRNTRG